MDEDFRLRSLASDSASYSGHSVLPGADNSVQVHRCKSVLSTLWMTLNTVFELLSSLPMVCNVKYYITDATKRKATMQVQCAVAP